MGGVPENVAATCQLCGEDFESVTTILDHLRVMHPEEYGDGPEKWPDGDYVVIDDTLAPEDFV